MAAKTCTSRHVRARQRGRPAHTSAVDMSRSTIIKAAAPCAMERIRRNVARNANSEAQPLQQTCSANVRRTHRRDSGRPLSGVQTRRGVRKKRLGHRFASNEQIACTQSISDEQIYRALDIKMQTDQLIHS